jgi:hypothetical protein
MIPWRRSNGKAATCRSIRKKKLIQLVQARQGRARYAVVHIEEEHCSSLFKDSKNAGFSLFNEATIILTVYHCSIRSEPSPAESDGHKYVQSQRAFRPDPDRVPGARVLCHCATRTSTHFLSWHWKIQMKACLKSTQVHTQRATDSA